MPRAILYPTGRAPASTAPETPHADAFRTEPPFVDRTPQVRPSTFAPKLPSTAPEAVHADAFRTEPPFVARPLSRGGALIASLVAPSPVFVAPAAPTTDPARWTGEARQPSRALPSPQMPQAPGVPSTAPEAVTADRIQASVAQPPRLPALWPRTIQSGPTVLPSLAPEATSADRIQANPWQPSRTPAARAAPAPSFVLPPAEVASWQPVQVPPMALLLRPQSPAAHFVWVAPAAAPVLPAQPTPWQPGRSPARALLWLPFGGGDVLLPVVTPPGEPGPLIFGPPTVTEVGSLEWGSLASVPAGPLGVTDVGGVVLVDVSEVDI